MIAAILEHISSCAVTKVHAPLIPPSDHCGYHPDKHQHNHRNSNQQKWAKTEHG
jgi:hypothetical protein